MEMGKQVLASIEWQAQDVNYVSISLDGRRILAALFDEIIQVWDMEAASRCQARL